MNSEDHDRQPDAPFDPEARRREIEKMERQFRERAERSGGGPIVTGNVDHRVQGEMQEFFAESEARLEQVVPGLDEGPGKSLSETTGEIREKLEQFFTQVNETAPASAVPPADLHKRQKRWAGMEAQPAADEPERRRPFSPSGGAGGGDKMDLKTALEKLKRHGVVKGAAREAAPPEPPPSPGVAGPTRSEISLTHEVRLPPIGSFATAGRAGAGQPAGPATVRPAPPPPAGFAARPAMRPVVPPPQRRPAAPRQPEPAPQQRAAPPQRRPAREIAPDTAPVLQPLPTAEIARPRRAAPVIPAASASRSVGGPLSPSHAGDDPVGEFDEIFSEVEDLVIATLRESTQALQLPPAQPGVPAGPPVGLGMPGVPAPAPRARPATASHAPLSQVLPPPRDDNGEEEEPEEEAPVGPHDWGVKTSAGPRGAWLLGTDVVPPTQTLEPRAVKPGQVRAQPANPPRLAPNVPPQMPKAPASEPTEQESGPASDGGGAGARQIIMKKLKQQTRSFEPVVQALREKNILSEADVAQEQSGPGVDSDEVSIDSFRDDRPRGDAANLSPMQMVEEIRRLRRIQDVLIRKGILDEEDIEQSAVD